MSLAVDNIAHPDAAEPVGDLSNAVQPMLRELPALLEYRSDADPDAEFIPKTVTGFGMGATAMGITMLVAEMLLLNVRSPQEIATKFAFMVGIVCVSTSLLLVGLKVRADHSATTLFARHWLNSIGTGAAFAVLVWGPWSLQNHAIVINRYLALAIWLAVMAFPLAAAKWTIGPRPDMPRPGVDPR